MQSLTRNPISSLLQVVLLCTATKGAMAQSVTQANLEKAYQHGVDDASIPSKAELDYNLWPVSKKNSRLVWNEAGDKVLVTTWKSKASYENNFKGHTKTSSNPDWVVWVSLVPQVQNMCENYLSRNPKASSDDLNLRLKQFLGLNYSWSYDVFLELWVNPDDLFRPCVDPGISDNHCNLNFGEKNPTVKNIANYPDFYQSLYFKSYRNARVPWTGLGYTFDWGNPLTEVGASEYIMSPDSSYEIKGVYKTSEYCPTP